MRIPPDTLAIFPTSVNLVYEQGANGEPVIGVLFDHRDKDFGHYMLWLSADAAASLADNITHILDNRDTFAAEWTRQKNGDTHE
jgi:hypothetical protein